MIQKKVATTFNLFLNKSIEKGNIKKEDVAACDKDKVRAILTKSTLKSVKDALAEIGITRTDREIVGYLA